MKPLVRLLASPLLFLVLTLEARADADPKNAVSPEAAASFFVSICYDIYLQDIGAAQAAAQRRGFRYDPESRLFVNPAKDQQMRINKQRCALRFLTKVPLPELLVRFGSTSTKVAKNKPPRGTEVHIGTEDAGNGLIRAAAKLDN